MRSNLFFLFSLLCAAGLASCKPRLVRVERAVPVVIPADSARIVVQADCPDGSAPVVRLIETQTGHNLTPSLAQKGDTLSFSATLKPDTVYQTITVSGPPVEVPVVQTVYRQRWWQTVLAWAGGMSLLILLIASAPRLVPRILQIIKKLI